MSGRDGGVEKASVSNFKNGKEVVSVFVHLEANDKRIVSILTTPSEGAEIKCAKESHAVECVPNFTSFQVDPNGHSTDDGLVTVIRRQKTKPEFIRAFRRHHVHLESQFGLSWRQVNLSEGRKIQQA